MKTVQITGSNANAHMCIRWSSIVYISFCMWNTIQHSKLKNVQYSVRDDGNYSKTQTENLESSSAHNAKSPRPEKKICSLLGANQEISK
jgi:hypothetical protein